MKNSYSLPILILTVLLLLTSAVVTVQMINKNSDDTPEVQLTEKSQTLINTMVYGTLNDDAMRQVIYDEFARLDKVQQSPETQEAARRMLRLTKEHMVDMMTTEFSDLEIQYLWNLGFIENGFSETDPVWQRFLEVGSRSVEKAREDPLVSSYLDAS